MGFLADGKQLARPSIAPPPRERTRFATLVIVKGVAARLDFGPSGCFNRVPQTAQYNDRENR
jgi:hypothetical protein